MRLMIDLVDYYIVCFNGRGFWGSTGEKETGIKKIYNLASYEDTKNTFRGKL